MESILNMKDKIRLISDMAFEAMDADESGQIDKTELGDVLRDVALDLGINIPSDNDLAVVLYELDQDGDS